MKFLSACCFVVFVALCAAEYTVDDIREAYEIYKNHPTKFGKPEWVDEIKDFDEFEKRWNEARAYNDKYKTTEEAWAAYKQANDLKYDAEEDEKRYQLYKPRWENILAHNEKYARGEIYYPQWTSDILIHETPEEQKLRESQPIP